MFLAFMGISGAIPFALKPITAIPSYGRRDCHQPPLSGWAQCNGSRVAIRACHGHYQVSMAGIAGAIICADGVRLMMFRKGKFNREPVRRKIQMTLLASLRDWLSTTTGCGLLLTAEQTAASGISTGSG